MAREAILLETNRQFRQNRKKGKLPAPGPVPRTVLTNKGTRVLTSEVVEDLKKKAEAKLEVDLKAKLGLGNN